MFLEDMEYSFREGLELDRINNNGNYEPSNCRWVSHKTNIRNKGKQKNCSSKYLGVCYNKNNKNWRAYVSIEGRNKHLGSFKTEKEAALVRDTFILENNLTYKKLNFNRGFEESTIKLHREK